MLKIDIPENRNIVFPKTGMSYSRKRECFRGFLRMESVVTRKLTDHKSLFYAGLDRVDVRM